MFCSVPTASALPPTSASTDLSLLEPLPRAEMLPWVRSTALAFPPLEHTKSGDAATISPSVLSGGSGSPEALKPRREPCDCLQRGPMRTFERAPPAFSRGNPKRSSGPFPTSSHAVASPSAREGGKTRGEEKDSSIPLKSYSSNKTVAKQE